MLGKVLGTGVRAAGRIVRDLGYGAWLLDYHTSCVTQNRKARAA